MLFDFNEAWSRVAEAQYDVCVCGTGPAGITIARKLASHGKKVLLLEAGGLSYQRRVAGSLQGQKRRSNLLARNEPPQVLRRLIKSLGRVVCAPRSYHL